MTDIQPLGRLASTPVRVLLVDDEAGYRRTRDLLAAAPHLRFVIDWARAPEDADDRLRAGQLDVCIVGECTPSGAGLEVARLARDVALRAPVVMVSDRGALELDLQAMGLGVSDFLDRRRMDSVVLERTIRYALARQRQAERLSRLAQYDELTGLANRSLFQDRLARALGWARRHERLVAVMILDLNGFKAVNDRLGHAAGDRLLTILGKRLTQRLRETDTVARLGGDEFALVIENLGKPEHAALVARKLLDTVAPPFAIDGAEATVTASLGIALYPRDGGDPETLLRLADRAMYRAKAEGGNLCRFASEQIERRVQRGALLEIDLRRGLSQGEFLLHYQPQVTLAPGALGVSALVRWSHPELGLIGPERFLPLAEDSGLLEALTDWLFEAACHQVRSWRQQGVEDVHLAVPLLTRRPLTWTGLAERLSRHQASAGVAPHQIEIELEEDSVLAELAAGGSTLSAVRELGVRVALDGFGRGPTSLRSLQPRLLDTLKLARELHLEVPDDTQRSALVGTILSLARQLGLRVVAEGVDRRDQLAFLRRHGCDAVQAFMSCPPLPADACTNWLEHAIGRQHPAHALRSLPAAVPGAGRGPMPAAPRVALARATSDAD